MADATRSFGDFRLRGGRYEQAGFPVEVVSELERYEQLVQDVARGLWRTDNPSKKRVPKGFSGALSLRLTAIGEGSVVPVLERPHTVHDAESNFDSFFLEARSLIEDAASAISDERPLPGRFPLSALSSLLRLGKSLRQDERYEFRWQSDRPVSYGLESRRQLYQRLEVSNYAADGSVVGRITGMQAEEQKFDFVTLRGKQLNGRYSDPGLTDDFKEVMHSVAAAPVVRLDGELQFGLDDDPVEVSDVRSVELFDRDSEPWSDRLVYLLSIQAGWLDGAGRPIELAAIEAARYVVRGTLARGLPLPGLFPMEDGGVQVEWQTDKAILSLDIAPDLSIDIFRLDLRDKSESERGTDKVSEAIDFVVEAGV